MAWVLTYNTADKPERRMVAGVYSQKLKAENAFRKLKASLGDFITDYEISQHEIDAE